MNLTLMNTAANLEESGGTIVLTAPARTDNFIDMFSREAKFTAPFYYIEREGDFVARCAIEPAFGATYDAGGLFVCESPARWIKLEFEMTDLGHPSAVAVVTDGVSDDANGERIDAPRARFQVARRGDCWSLHYAADGGLWKMVRYFHLAMNRRVKVGIQAQSPVGEGCRVAFTGFEVLDNTLANMRAGM